MRGYYYILLIAIVVIAGVFVFGRIELTEAQQEFKKTCESDSKQWMFMEPMADGKITSDKKCWGCMADNINMICGQDEYKLFNRKK